MFDQFFYGWLVIALFLIMEMGSPGFFFFISFFAGALGSAVASLFLLSFFVQTIVFLCVTSGSFVFLRYWVKKQMIPRHVFPTNVYALQGKRGYVIKKIEQDFSGQVKVRGQVWSAQSYNNQIIEKNSAVEIIDIRGVHLIVKKLKG